MKLNEIKNIEAIKAETLSNVKGGGRDTRSGQTIGISPIMGNVTNTKPR